MKQRVEYIDLAKGFCILLVILGHTFGPLNNTETNTMLGSFRMPLYFFLSGLFFKRYAGLVNFILRKINKLVIPFFFFTITAYILYIAGWLIKGRFDLISELLKDIAINFREEFVYLNPPLWFLMTLFNTSLIFYLLIIISDKLYIKSKGARNVAMAVICFTVGISGFELGVYHINLPLWIDTSMTAVPFYFLGYFFKEETDFLIPNKSDRLIPVYLVALAAVVYFLAKKIELVTNTYQGDFISFYVTAICGTLFVLLVAKLINKKVPIISFLGRYSIIVLGTHWFILLILNSFLSFIQNGWLLTFVLVVLVAFIEIPVVLFLIRFFPKFVCQKDLIKVDSFKPVNRFLTFPEKQLISPYNKQKNK